jgi:hypothetical protein
VTFSPKVPIVGISDVIGDHLAWIEFGTRLTTASKHLGGSGDENYEKQKRNNAFCK